MTLKQSIVVLCTLGLMGVLLSLNIKKAGKPAGSGRGIQPVASNKPNPKPAIINIDSLQAVDRAVLEPEQAKKLEAMYLSVKSHPSFTSYMALASLWASNHKPIWSGHFYFLAAQEKPSLVNWLKAGNTLNEALATVQDTTEQKLLYSESSSAFLKSLTIDSTNQEAKTGLGVSYVAGGNNPMQGIGLLLQVVGKDPKNLKANFSLGLFSMKSGQYEKAIKRFETVVSVQPGGEAYFYMAQAYQNLGMKKQAVEAYLASKKYIDDPQTLASIDHFIKELTN